MKGATPLHVLEEMKQAKRMNRIYNLVALGLGALVLFAEPIVEALL